MCAIFRPCVKNRHDSVKEMYVNTVHYGIHTLKVRALENCCVVRLIEIWNFLMTPAVNQNVLISTHQTIRKHWFSLKRSGHSSRKLLHCLKLDKPWDNAWSCMKGSCHSHLHAPPFACIKVELSRTRRGAAALAWNEPSPSCEWGPFYGWSTHWRIPASAHGPAHKYHPVYSRGEGMYA